MKAIENTTHTRRFYFHAKVAKEIMSCDANETSTALNGNVIQPRSLRQVK